VSTLRDICEHISFAPKHVSVYYTLPTMPKKSYMDVQPVCIPWVPSLLVKPPPDSRCGQVVVLKLVTKSYSWAIYKCVWGGERAVERQPWF